MIMLQKKVERRVKRGFLLGVDTGDVEVEKKEKGPGVGGAVVEEVERVVVRK
jgi:hypothetical protein